MNLEAAASQTEPFSRAEEWAWAKMILHWVVLKFGAPGEIAERQWLKRRFRKRLLDWLLPLENFVRRLLFLEAAALPKPNALRRRTRARKNIKKQVGRPGFGSADSRDWGVSFKLSDQGPNQRSEPARAKTRRGMKRARVSPLAPARPVAERFEALLRVAENPASYAQRLARRLHDPTRPDLKKAGPVAIAPPPAFKIDPIGPPPRAAQREDEIAAAAFNDTS